MFIAIFAQSARAVAPVSLQLAWYHQFQFAGFYAAQIKGLYKKAGLDVEILNGRPGINLAEYVTAQPGRFGISNTDLLLERARGQDVVAIAAIFQHSAEVLITLEKNGFRKPSDLAGKRVMARYGLQTQSPAIRAMFIAEGVSPDTVQWVPHSWNLDDLLNGNVDAMSGYSTAQVPMLQKRKIPIHVISPLNYGIDFYGDLLFTSGDTLNRSASTVQAFTRASLEGWRYAFDHVDEICDYILTLPGVKERGLTRDLLQAEAAAMRRLFEPELIEIGYSNTRRWERILHLYKSSATLPDSFSLDDFFLQERGQIRRVRQAQFIRASITILLLVGLVLLWIFQLRRQVARKTEALQAAMKKSDEQRALAERANRVKSLFLANMSHEIRTPLTAILGFVEILRDGRLSESERNEYLSIIQRTGQSLATILNDILDLAKVEAGQLEVRESICNLPSLMNDVEKLVRLRGRGENVALTFAAGKLEATDVITDPIRFKQIVLNIVGNALKFTPEGFVSVVYGAERGKITVRVTDTGIGISPDEQIELFRPFSQVDQSFRKEHSGTGLGLTISRRLARLLGGDVTLERSELKQGTEFKIEISYRLPPASVLSARSSTDPNAPAPHRLAGRKILVVDDSEDNQLLVKLFLEKEGANVALVNNGEEAVNIVKKDDFDLIFMDIQMPVMDGYAATATLRSNGYTGSIIALTANAMSEDLERCLDAGCDDFLAKPVRKIDLIDFALRYSNRVSDNASK